MQADPASQLGADRQGAPTADIVAAYRPIVRGYLIGAAGYYVLISLTTPLYEKQASLVLLEGLALAALGVGVFFWLDLKRAGAGMARLEVAALAMNALFMANTIAYQSVHFEPAKLIYFVLMSLAFAISAPSRRVAALSVAVATAGLVWMARRAPGDLIGQYGFIGLAGGVTAVGLSTLMRGAVMRELTARIAADTLNRTLEDELGENRRLRLEAQALAYAAQTASRAKTEFLATMSHEIRTPLNGVLGMAQAMENDALSGDQRERLAVLKASGQSLLEVVNAILDISNIETGKVEITPGAFDLEAFAGALRRLYAGAALERGLSFRLDLDPGVAGWRFGDEARLRQVLGNLISNAIKFTETGSVTVTIGGDDAQLAIQVEDTGIGIPADRQAEIFQTFVQVDGSSTRRGGGAGLGLAICRELVTLMGGSLTFESTLDAGSRFAFNVPASPVDQVESEASPAASLGEAVRILVVDDNQTNRIVLRSLLGHLGVECGFATDGCEAVTAWESECWDAILMDIHMPRMDGVDACRAIRQGEAASGRQRTPIIAVTASVLLHETDRYFSAGMDGVVPKPIEITTLVGAIDAAMAAQPQWNAPGAIPAAG